MAELEQVPYLLYEKEDNGVLWIKFNRPERLNAVIGGADKNGTLTKVLEYMKAGDDDPDVRVIVLTGVGRGFCSGADQRGLDDFDSGGKLLGTVTSDSADASRQGFHYATTKTIRDINYIRKPTVAMINGVAAGFGMDMALACDIRYGCENTRFITYQQVGQIVENGGCYWLPKLMGIGRALEFGMTGYLDAQTAHDWGVLNRLVPSEKLEEEVRALCDRLLYTSPTIQWINKRIMRASLETSLETVSVMTSNASGIMGRLEDSQEARRALAERRTPVFKGK